jgi:hypothetical protein
MPRYIIERNVPGITREQLDAAARRSIDAASQMQGIVWIRSYISEAEGKIYCEYDAPDPEAIRDHAVRAGLPADKISLVSLEVEPTMFQ